MADESQFKHLLPWSASVFLFLGSLITITLGVYLEPLFSRIVHLSANGTPIISTTPDQAVVKEDLICYFSNNEKYNVNLPSFLIVDIVGNDRTGNWALVKTKEFADCWVELKFLDPKGDINSLPVITKSFPPAITSTAIHPTLTSPISETPVVITGTPSPFTETPVVITGTPSPFTETPVVITETPSPFTETPVVTPTRLPIELRWKIISYVCNDDGDVTNVVVGLDVSGGIPPYKYSTKLPINAKPKQALSITVKSSTSDDKPSITDSYTVPRASDFKCKTTGSNPGPMPNPTSTPVPPPVTTVAPPPVTTVAPPPITTVAPPPITTVAPPPITTVAPPPITTVAPPPTSTPSGPRQCSDGIDNDSDGKTDYPADDGCKNNGDDSE